MFLESGKTEDMEEHPEVDENGDPLKEEDERNEEGKKDDKKKRDEPRIDWEGAPEFQWKSMFFTVF